MTIGESEEVGDDDRDQRICDIYGGSDDVKSGIRVRAAEFTEVKVVGLKLKTREYCLDLVLNALTKNYTTMEARQCSAEDIIEDAIKAEYDLFTNTKGITMYRWKIIKLISSITGNTDEILDHVIQDLKNMDIKPRLHRDEDEHEDGDDDGCVNGRGSRCSDKAADSEDGGEKAGVRTLMSRFKTKDIVQAPPSGFNDPIPNVLCQAICINGEQCNKKVAVFPLLA